ncbi:MAG: nuclease [Comamonadaceae bacterium CG12_big_fil_rev_8_21_14_0_65_59_15]|nr:MAG: nuclease [Comamonadaceae bacterium CG12_big_fil_rev_8_21_14_0_65_59_15]
MAKLCPSLAPHVATCAGDYAELELLQTLERGLSDAYTLFHSVDWSRGDGEYVQHGEIDIVVVNQAGDVLLLEVKAGNVDFLPDGIFKTYDGKPKNISRQMRLQKSAMSSRLASANLQVHLHHLLVLPNFQVQSETAQWPREQIIDSDDIGNIVSRISQQLGVGLPNPDVYARVLSFLENRFKVALDVSALAGNLQQVTRRLSAGLATWVPRIDTASGLIRVIGTAGSGKTQLALRLLRDADAAGQRVAYLCFNRALADHIATVAPVKMPAETFHEFALHVVRRAGHVVDFKQPQAFATMVAQCMALLEQRAPDLDLIVIDEMQDMQPEWVLALLSRLKANGKAFLLEDPEQQLYKDRVEFDLPDAVSITSHENFRTPRALVRLINLYQLTNTEVEALSPYEGEIPDPIVYDAPEKIVSRTVQAVKRCLQQGFSLNEIAVVSMRGREKSALLNLNTLGAWTLNRFTGGFDEGGGAIWSTGGQLLIESVRRFKGQAAAAVVLTECDMAELDAVNKRLLFVGLTRARVHLEWVISSRMAQILAQVIES